MTTPGTPGTPGTPSGTVGTPRGYFSIGDWSEPDQCVKRLLSAAVAHPDKIITATCGAWSLCFSGPDAGDTRLGNVFSARVRRSTKERDWEILGRMSARVGAPMESTPKTIETDATATHYWIWGGTATPEESKGLLQKALEIFYKKVGS